MVETWRQNGNFGSSSGDSSPTLWAGVYLWVGGEERSAVLDDCCLRTARRDYWKPPQVHIQGNEHQSGKRDDQPSREFND